MNDSLTNATALPDKIDRIAPTIRPNRPVGGYQNWRSLLFLHWAVPAESLRELVPRQLTLDLFDGVAYVGIVPFVMQGVRPSWWPKCCALKFLETNVRAYVHCNGRPGVYFLSLDADSRLAVWGARTTWGLPYYLSEKSFEQRGDEICFSTRRRRSAAGLTVRYKPGEHLGPSVPGTLEHFLLERYLLFVERKGTIYAGHVHHSPYPVQHAEILELDESFTSAAGLQTSTKTPIHAHYSAGVDVEVFSLRAVTHRESDV